MTQEALKLALEALEYMGMTAERYVDNRIPEAAITAIKEALREHALKEVQRLGQEIEQEPVAWMFQHDETGRMNYVSNDGIHNPTMFLEMNPRYALVCALYATPPQRTWVGLTPQQRDEINERVYGAVPHHVVFHHAIEARLKELNT